MNKCKRKELKKLKKLKIVNKKKFIKAILTLIITLALFGFMTWLFVDFVMYPESYLTTWRYQLKLDIERGDQEAIDYYQQVYLDNNRPLWEE